MVISRVFPVLFSSAFLFANISCDMSKNVVENEKVTVLESFKTPLTGGANVQGMKISVNVKVIQDVKFDSIVYNSRSSVINTHEGNNKTVWLVSHFYNENRPVVGSGPIVYKAEGDFCDLFYTLNNKVKSIRVSGLILKQDGTLWE